MKSKRIHVLLGRSVLILGTVFFCQYAHWRDEALEESFTTCLDVVRELRALKAKYRIGKATPEGKNRAVIGFCMLKLRVFCGEAL